MRRALFVICFIFSCILPIYSLDTPPKELIGLKERTGGSKTSIEDILLLLGNNYTYSEVDAYGYMPNVRKTDKMLVYDFDGIKYMFFRSLEFDKFFLYYWEITSDRYLIETSLFLGMSHDDFLSYFRNPHNSYNGYESYNFPDGDVFFEFNNTSSLKSIFWNIGD